MKYIPFDLEKAIAGHRLVTRDGRMVTEFHRFQTIATPNYHPCVYVVNGERFTCDDHGRHRVSDDENDLFLASTEVKMWQNVFRKEDGEYFTDGALWTNEGRAKACARGENIIATVPITFPIPFK